MFVPEYSFAAREAQYERPSGLPAFIPRGTAEPSQTKRVSFVEELIKDIKERLTYPSMNYGSLVLELPVLQEASLP